jgi:hypothetical protein
LSAAKPGAAERYSPSSPDFGALNPGYEANPLRMRLRHRTRCTQNSRIVLPRRCLSQVDLHFRVTLQQWRIGVYTAAVHSLGAADERSQIPTA